MKNRNLKTYLVSGLTAVLLMSSAVSLSACSSKPPEIDTIYDRLVEVIEESHDINVVLFGAGLPVYERDSAEDRLIHRYYGQNDDGREFITPYARYLNTTEIREAIERVYGEEYRASLIESLLTGYAESGLPSVLPARYSEDEKWMYQNKYVEPLVEGGRVFDYATMKIVEPSTAKHIRVEIQSYTDKDPTWKPAYISFVYENGSWFLDSPSC